MPSIKFLLSITLSLLLSLNSVEQVSCEISNLSQEDKSLLEEFWTKLKTAINKEDKTMLAQLCNFSFECSYCILDDSQNNNSKVSKDELLKASIKFSLIKN
jgi:sulfatase maturation enzyme AslB (radical SAM superfamily)